MKKLPISSDPYIKAYTYHAYTDAIINNENTNSKIISKIELPSEKLDDLEIIKDGIEIRRNGEELLIATDLYAKTNFCAFRRVKKNDSIIVKINYQQYTKPWGNINLFLTNNRDNLLEDKDYICKFINFCCDNICFKSKDEFICVNKRNSIYIYPVYLQLQVDGEQISCLYSDDILKWHIGYKYQINKNSIGSLYLGVKTELSENQYFDWLFSNYIQIKLNENWCDKNSVPIDYDIFPKKNYSNYTLHNLIDFNHESERTIEAYGLNILEYIIIQINNDSYVDIKLNEKYIPNRKAYQNYDFTHPNLIYGYHEIDKKLFIMGYSIIDKPILSEISFDTFWEAFNHCDSRDYHVLKYNPDKSTYKLDLELINSSLESYISGRNTSNDYSRISVPGTEIYGMDIYAELIKNSTTINAFMKDDRIAYLLFEHKKIMRDRINYLTARKIFNHNDISDINKSMLEIYYKSEIIKNLVIKFKIYKDQDIINRITVLMKELIKLETKCYSGLCRVLAEKINKGEL